MHFKPSQFQGLALQGITNPMPCTSRRHNSKALHFKAWHSQGNNKVNTTVGPPLLPSNLYKRPHLWQISGRGVWNPPPPLDPRLQTKSYTDLNFSSVFIIYLLVFIYSRTSRMIRWVRWKRWKKYELEDKVRISRWWMHACCYEIETRLTIILYIKIHVYGTLELFFFQLGSYAQTLPIHLPYDRAIAVFPFPRQWRCGIPRGKRRHRSRGN